MDHLVNALKEHYTIAIDMRGSLFCRIQLTWNYTQGHVDCHMPGYINTASQSTNTPNQSLFNMLPTKGHQSNMAQVFRGWRLTPHNPSPQKESNLFKTLLVPSCTMRERLVQHFLLHSAKLQHGKPTAHGQWQMHVTNSSIMLPLTQMQAFDTKRATWYFQYTQMLPTFLKQGVKVERRDISTYPIAMTKTSTIAPYSHCQLASNTSCRQHLRPSLPHSTTAASLLLHFFEPHLRNLATSNQLPLLSPLTTLLPKA
jgi:hypothetical protein